MMSVPRKQISKDKQGFILEGRVIALA